MDKISETKLTLDDHLKALEMELTKVGNEDLAIISVSKTSEIELIKNILEKFRSLNPKLKNRLVIIPKPELEVLLDPEKNRIVRELAKDREMIAYAIEGKIDKFFADLNNVDKSMMQYLCVSFADILQHYGLSTDKLNYNYLIRRSTEEIIQINASVDKALKEMKEKEEKENK